MTIDSYTLMLLSLAWQLPEADWPSALEGSRPGPPEAKQQNL